MTKTATARKLDKLAAALDDVGPGRMEAFAETVLHKSDVVRARVSVSEKESITRAADRYGMTVTDYLLSLHRLAEQNADGKAKRNR